VFPQKAPKRVEKVSALPSGGNEDYSYILFCAGQAYPYLKPKPELGVPIPTQKSTKTIFWFFAYYTS
jgi:hypothetical protein